MWRILQEQASGSWAGAVQVIAAASQLSGTGTISGDLPGRTEAAVCSQLWSVPLA